MKPEPLDKGMCGGLDPPTLISHIKISPEILM
jgi:hypothetical protein